MEKLKNFINLCQGKLSNLLNFLKPKLSALAAKTGPVLSFFKNLSKRNKLIILIAVFVIVFALELSYSRLFQGKGGENGTKDKPIDKKEAMFSSIEKAELAGTFAPSEVARVGSMEVTIYNVKEGSFTSFDRDENDNRIEKKYFAANIKIFNDSEVANDTLLIGLEDDAGNRYAIDNSIEFYVDNMKGFGPDENVYHRTIREGYLFYPAPPEAAKKLNLIFFSGITNKKIIFEIGR